MTRTLRVLLATTVMAILLSACAQPDTAGRREISFLLFGDAVEAAGYQDLVTAFEAEHPDTDVVLTTVASQDDLLAKLTTSFAGGNPPDVFLINFRKYGQFAAQGLLEAIGPRLATSTLVSEDDLYAAPLDAFRFDGTELTCLPQNVSSLVVYYNVDLLRAAGATEPSDTWSWDDFLTTAQVITDAEADTYGLGVDPKLIRLAPFVWSNGGELVDDQTTPTTLTLEDGSARESLDWFLDLQSVHHVVPDDRGAQSEDNESRFLNGRLGMFLDSRRFTPTMRTVTDFAWDVAPLPIAPGGEPVTMLHSDAYCLSAGTDGNGWDLAEFAMSDAGQRILAASGRTVPSRRDVASSDAFLGGADGPPPSRAGVFLSNAEIVRATPHIPAWTRVEKQADGLLAELFYGRIDRAEGIRQMIEQSRAQFADNG